MALSSKGMLLIVAAITIILLLPEAQSEQPQNNVQLLRRQTLGIQDIRTSHPANITGTFKGEWSHLNSHLKNFLVQDTGMLVFRITTLPSLRQGMQNVQGDLVLRDGLYVTENDVAMKLQGVYVQDAGRLTAVLEPSSAVYGRLSQKREGRFQDADYRAAVRDAAKSIRGHLLPDSTMWVTKQQELPRKCQFSLNIAFSRLSEVMLTDNDDDNDEDDNTASAIRSAQQYSLKPAGLKIGKYTTVHVDSGETLLVNGTLTSGNCGVSLELGASSAHIERYYSKALRYTLMTTAAALVQVALTVGQMESASTQASASKLSLLCIGQQAVLDAYLCLLHLTLGILVEPLFNAFATAAFVQFCVFGIFEMRMLLVAWRARRGNGALVDPWTAQRELSALYARFYGALLAGILLSYQLQKRAKFVTLALHSFWIPQILLCVKEDSRQPLKPSYVIGTSITRLLLPLYIYGCPKNLLRVPPSPAMCAVLVTFVGIQAGILVIQRCYGPRCFIPRRFLPPKYDYFRKRGVPSSLADGVAKGGKLVSQSSGGSGGGLIRKHSSFEEGSGSYINSTGRLVMPSYQMGAGVLPEATTTTADIEVGNIDEDCVICMNPLDGKGFGRTMVGPCDHAFHQECLEQWLAVKMECPTCRRPLPAP